MRRLGRGTVFGILALVLVCGGCAKSGPTGPGMHKYVTESGAFVLYAPGGWKATDACEDGCWTLAAKDAAGTCGVMMVTGCGKTFDNTGSVAKYFAAMLGREHPDMIVAKAWKDASGSREVFEGTYSAGGNGKKEFRSWVGGKGGDFLCMTVESPEGKLASMRGQLLTILASVRATNASTKAKAEPEKPVAAKKTKLVERRLADGSATFLLPEDWKFVSLGKGHFVANDPASRYSFACKETPIITPSNPFPRVAGVPVLAYMEPTKGFQALKTMQGINNMQFLSAARMADAEAGWKQNFTAGPVMVEDFTFTCRDGRGVTYKGFSHAVSLGSWQGYLWTFLDTTVSAPVDEFDAFAGNFATMMQSYKIDKEWANKALAQSAQNLANSQAKLRQAITDYGQSTSAMIKSAYDERQKSQDYLSYQRSQVIRGQSDWVSQVEGGSVYHTDSWGTKNTYTGESFEGAPYDSVNFKGGNPKYNETMTPIDTRALWEKNIRNK